MLLNALILSMNTNYKCKKCVLDIETECQFPTDGRIICIGAKEIHSGEVKEFYDKSEEILLTRFLKYFNEKNFKEIIGFNVFYDIRFIFAKCLKYKIHGGTFFSAFYTDIMMILKSVRRVYNFNRPGTLDQWARFLIGKGKIMNNASVPALYRQGRINEILEYNRNDVEITFELWERIIFVLDGRKNG